MPMPFPFPFRCGGHSPGRQPRRPPQDDARLFACRGSVQGLPEEYPVGPGPREAGRVISPHYIFGGKLAGSITYQTLFTPCPLVSPGALSPVQ